MKKVHLRDDGTLDHVFKCKDCRQEIRYATDHFQPEDDREEIASSDHAAECEGPEDTSHYALACRWHGGQWTSLYAFLSSGTVTHGLAKEIRTCVAIAERQGEHMVEIASLKDFLTWAEGEENKLPTSD